MTVNNKTVVLILVSATLTSAILITNYLLWAAINPAGWLCLALFFALLLSLIPLIFEFKRSWPVLVVVIFVLLLTLFIGSTSWDARHIWLFHAKRIFFDGSLYAQMDNYANAANDYPVIVPALSASIASALGFWNEAAPKSAGVFFLIAPLLACLLALKNPIYFLIYLSGVFYLCGEHLLNGEMDGILALYSCAMATSILLLSNEHEQKQKSHPRSWQLLFILLTLFAIITPLIKNEGLVITLIFLISIFTMDSFRSNYKLLLPFLIGISFYLITWQIPLLLNSVINDVANKGIISNLVMRLQEPQSIELITNDFLNKSGACLALFGVSLLLKKSYWRKYSPVVFFLALYLLFLFFIYLGTPYSLEWHILTSSERTLLPINVTAFGLSLFLLKGDFARAWHWLDALFEKSNITIKTGLIALTCAVLLSPILIFNANRLKLDQPILFGKGQPGGPYLREVTLSDKKGWSSPEEWGVWAVGTPSSVELPLPVLLNANKLNVFLRAYLPKSIDHQNVKLYINGQLVNTITLSAEYTYIENLPIPGFWGRQGPMSLSFAMERPITPSSIDKSDDNRALSIGLIFVSYQTIGFWDYLKSITDLKPFFSDP